MGIAYSVPETSKPNSVPLTTDNTYRPTDGSFSSKEIRHLCIGINYSKTEGALTGCINDARLMEGYIQGKGSVTGIFLSDDQEAEGAYYPCRSNIIRALKWVLSSATEEMYQNSETEDFPPSKPGTLVFITYSGHGYHVADLNKDEVDGYDEVICPVARGGDFDEYLSDDTIGEILYSRAREDCFCVLITDCCMSGTVADMRFTIQNKGFKEDRNYPVMKAPVIHISGCKDAQSSYEGQVDNVQGGYLTTSLLSVLGKTPKCSLYSLITRVRGKIASYIAVEKQLPQLSCAHKTSVNAPFPL